MLTTSALSEDRVARVALVIGNAGYLDAGGPLATTIRDARTLADELRRFDFDVDLKEDVRRNDMQRAIDAFTGKINPGTVALLYFGGVGLEVGRQTYLIPVDAQIWSEADVRRDGSGLDGVLAEMHRKGAKAKIVIIDAARRNPYERRFRTAGRGLAVPNAPEGTLALFATAPGKLVRDDNSAGNSLFLRELIKELRVPERTAGSAFNRARIGVARASKSEQVPWVASSLLDGFYFGGSPRSAKASAPRAAPAHAPEAAPVRRPTSSASAPSSAPPTTAPPAAGSVHTALKPGDSFRDCADCPEMVVVPAGSYGMGSKADHEGPVHRVSIARPFAIGRREVTFDEWDRCVDAGGCKYRGDDQGWGRGDRPVVDISWLDAKEFATWLSRKTGQVYRLPTEAEWEYAARGGTKTAFWWGRRVGSGRAHCRECDAEFPQRTLPVGSLAPNPFGLHDTAGNAAEWVEDCWNENYRGAPRDGSAWTSGQCSLRVLRGGAFDSQARYLRSASRFRYDSDVRYFANGFRLVRELQQDAGR